MLSLNEAIRRTVSDPFDKGVHTHDLLDDDLDPHIALQVNELSLANNELVVLPEWLALCRNVRRLSLENNRLVELPDWIEQLGQLETLRLAKNRLEALPLTLGKLDKLTTLILSNNNLSTLAAPVAALPNLTQLVTDHNNIERLDERLLSASALRILDLAYNRLASLELGAANSALEELRLEHNALTSLEGIEGFRKLKFLNASSNRLEALPDSLGKLANLEQLYLANNRLVTLPPSIGNLRKLRSIDLKQNPIRRMPLTIAQLPEEALRGIEERWLAPELAAALSSGQLADYQLALGSDPVELTECKLLLVGEGEAGKSSLLAALRGEPFDSHRASTHGLQVKTVRIASGLGDVDLRCWDFGGQPQYRPTHQLFFSAPAVYLIVWRPRTGPAVAQIEYWIDQVGHRAGTGVPILIVATHADLERQALDIDETRLIAKYGDNIKGFFHISNKSGFGLEELIQAISTECELLPNVQRLVPRRWLEARDAVTALGRPYLSYDEFNDVVLAGGTKGISVESLAPVGHTLGWWVYYSEHDELRDLVVLQGDWLSTAISLVVDDEITRRAHGLLNHERLSDIWSDPRRPSYLQYPGKFHRQFLQLMDLFDIAYRAPDKVGRPPVSLVPLLLPSAKPNLSTVWTEDATDREATAFCRLTVAGSSQPAVPDGLMPRLIVRTHWLSLGNQDLDRAVHWRGGAVLMNRYGARALIELEADGVSIIARGPDPAGLLNNILEVLRDLVSSFWPGVETVVELPCPRCATQRQFNLDALHQRFARGKKDAECAHCFERIPVEVLISQLAAPMASADLAVSHAGLNSMVADVRRAHGDLAQQMRNDMLTMFRALASQADTNLSILLRSMSDEVANGPRLFTVEPLKRSITSPHVTHVGLRVTLYCEHSYNPVYVLDKRSGSGVYDIKVPKEWWEQAIPWIAGVARLLKILSGIGGPAIEFGLSDTAWDQVDEITELASGVTSSVADSMERMTGSKENFRGQPGAITAEGSLLRQLHVILSKRDPGFADLRRVRNQSGFLWVHRKFVNLYPFG